MDTTTLAVTCLVAGKHRVKVTIANYTVQFAVKVVESNKSMPYIDIPFYNNCLQDHWLSYWKQMCAKYKLMGENGKITIFVGDSFFDEQNFWTKPKNNLISKRFCA